MNTELEDKIPPGNIEFPTDISTGSSQNILIYQAILTKQKINKTCELSC